MCFADLAYKKVAIALEGLQCGFCTARYVANQLYLKFENGNQIHVWYGNKGNLNSFKLLVWPDDADANLVREKLHCVEGAMPPADGHYWRFAAYWEVSNQLGLIGFNGIGLSFLLPTLPLPPHSWVRRPTGSNASFMRVMPHREPVVIRRVALGRVRRVDRKPAMTRE